MRRTLVLCVCLVLFPAVLAAAGNVNKGEQVVNRDEQAVNSYEREVSVDEQSVRADEQAVATEEQSETKELSGMSIVGNDEAPKSLYIVPWKSSEIGAETSLNTMLNEGDVPVDRDVFKRQLRFYHLSTKK
jgi:hypothetical protein